MPRLSRSTQNYTTTCPLNRAINLVSGNPDLPNFNTLSNMTFSSVESGAKGVKTKYTTKYAKKRDNCYIFKEGDAFPCESSITKAFNF